MARLTVARKSVWPRRIAWFAALWLSGVAATGAVAFAIRSVLL